jgi:tetratricopeptide (TPR) repeat protein
MKRIFVNIALSAGLAALAPAHAAPDAQGIEDVQVGERQLQTRIALICESACAVEKLGGPEFFVRGVVSEMALDLTKRSRNITGFSMAPKGEGSALHVETRRILEYANTKACKISGRAAACIDLFFADAEPSQAQLATPSLAAAPKQSEKPVASPPEEKKPQAAAPKPVLRESAPERLSRFASLAPPERLAPPQPAQLASVTPVQKPVEASKPVMREDRPLPPPEEEAFDYAAQVEMLLGRKLTPGFCASAKATLQSDPWALDAMVNVGLCEAAAGDAEAGDAMLSRLLEYTPDNYEAYVGRALIALQAGEKSVARRYFQSALDAPPPIDESTRIVRAMQSL